MNCTRYDDIKDYRLCHTYSDERQVCKIYDSMVIVGWNGPPLLIDTAYKIVFGGTHRMEALRRMSILENKSEIVQGVLASIPYVYTSLDPLFKNGTMIDDGVTIEMEDQANYSQPLKDIIQARHFAKTGQYEVVGVLLEKYLYELSVLLEPKEEPCL